MFRTLWNLFIQWLTREERRWEREAQLRTEERTAQRELIETLFKQLLESQRVSHEPIHELARAQMASAEVLQQWLKGFQITNPEPVEPQTVSPEKEWLKEQQWLQANGLPNELPPDLPPEFALALELHRGAAADFDREGSDFT